MGISYFSSSGYKSLDDNLEELITRSVRFKRKDANSIVGSLSFNGRDSEHSILKALSSRKMIIEGSSLSFKKRENDAFQVGTKFSVKSPRAGNDDSSKPPISNENSWFNKEKTNHAPEAGAGMHEAAVKLQKVYKSFRTRRKLADCAVLVEQRWWKLLDFALLKRSSVSFFDIERPESVISRWSRARTRAAMVGRGLSKDEKAQKLALQHWLEAIDPRHRYGHNLHFYYVSWHQCESRQPFFYWLDVGEGKEVNLEQCPRPKLQHQCIKYLGPKEREIYEVIIQERKFVYKQSKQILDTSESLKDNKWIFVLSTSKKLYVGQKMKGTFQHSSFLAGGATSAAGRIVVEKGNLKAVWPHSGHYRPTEENFEEFMNFLKDNKVDLTDIKRSPTEDDEEPSTQVLDQENEVQQPHPSNAQNHETTDTVPLETNNSNRDKDASVFDGLHALHAQNLFIEFEGDGNADGKLDFDEKLKGNDSYKAMNGRIQHNDNGRRQANEQSTHQQLYTFHKRNLFNDEQNENEGAVTRKLILNRIDSKKGMKSLQLGKQLSCKWTTGAGPRIGIVRDYPSELQFQALEQVNLSPRSIARFKDHASSFISDPSSLKTRTPRASLLKDSIKETDMFLE